jgi:site-specific recombinase XerD
VKAGDYGEGRPSTDAGAGRGSVLSELVDTAANIDHYRRDVADHVLPALGVRPLVEVSPAEIARLLEQVEADTSGAVADQVRATLRELFAYAVDERLIASSPVQPVRRAGPT